MFPTFFGGVKAVIPRYVLYVIHQGGSGKNVLVLIDAVYCVLECQLSAAVSLFLREYCP